MNDLPLLARLARPWVRAELPGWYRVYCAIGGEDETRWTSAGERVFESRFHPHRMTVRLSNWSERKSWFLGRYYELETQLFLSAALRPGDVFVDVGANIGMITLLGAHRVGPPESGGRVISVEPNPVPADRLRRVLAANGLKHVDVREVGLSDREDVLELRVVGAHTGAGSFAAVDAGSEREVSFARRVPVLRGDDLLADVRGAAGAAWTIKIDVEGFECRVLRGLERTLREHRPALLTEAIEPQLVRAGASLRELFALLVGQGYRAHVLASRRGGLGKELALAPIEAPAPGLPDDLAWIAPGSPHEARLAAFVR
ncbi:MAG: FkbM family methyltransferase [Planctomycetes bacterium]|nr:FkbM family methyltransferase [Planctomycetota bacterium]